LPRPLQEAAGDAYLADATIDQKVGAAKTMIIKAFDNDRVGGIRPGSFRMEAYLANVDQTVEQNGNFKNESL